MLRVGNSISPKLGLVMRAEPAAANRYDNPGAGSPGAGSVVLERLNRTGIRSTQK